MRIPKAPARPKFSKAIALTSVSTMALVVSCAASNEALAACAANSTVSGTWVCTDTSSVTSNISLDFSSVNTTTITYDGVGNTLTSGVMGIKVDATSLTGNTATLTNTKDISVTLDTPSSTNNNSGNNLGVYGIKGRDAFGIETWEFDNSGSVSAKTNGVGEVAAIALQDDAEAWTIKNSGSLVVERGAITTSYSISSGTVTFTATPNPTNGLSASALRVAAAIYHNEEEVRDFNIENTEDGEILANGKFAVGIFARANSLELENEGTIKATDATGAAIVTWDGRLRKFYPNADLSAANCTTNAANSDPDDDCTAREMGFGKSFIENAEEGKIYGNVIVSGSNGLQVLGALATSGVDVNSIGNGAAVERRDSHIVNDGTIEGNIYLQSGSHTFVNNGTITNGLSTATQNFIVDQRRLTDYNDNTATSLPYKAYVAGKAAAFEDDEDGEEDEDGAPTIYEAATRADAIAALVAANPDHYFEFENAGTFTGDLTVLTNTSVSYSEVVIKPHITGSGAGSTLASPSENSSFIDGTLSIGTGTLSGWTPTMTASTISADGAPGTTKTTIAPVIDSLVHKGETFLVAEHLYGTALPGTEGTILVNWTAYQVGGATSGNALAIEASVNDASVIPGLTGPGLQTINGLMNTETDDEDVLAFGGAVQNMTDAAALKTLGEQLAPDTSYATTKAAIQLASLYGNAIGQRLAGGMNGQGSATGGSGFAPPSGLGMGSGDTSRYAAPMHLSSSDEGGYAAAPGREGAWAQAFGAKLTQDAVSSTGAYDADVYGFMGGYDGSLAPNFRAGVAFGYGNTAISETGVRQGDKTDMDSYNATLYAATKGANWYLTGQLGYTSHDFTTQRVVNAGGITGRANGSHDGDQFTAAGELGAPIRMAGAVVTPVASLAYNKLDQDGYTETGTKGVAQVIGSQSSTSLVSGLGVRGSFALGSGSAIEARAIWLHEFEDTNQSVTASFASASNAFTATGASLSADSANLGAGLNLNSGTGYSLQLNYDAYVSDDFIAHAGTGRVRVEF